MEEKYICSFKNSKIYLFECLVILDEKFKGFVVYIIILRVLY